MEDYHTYGCPYYCPYYGDNYFRQGPETIKSYIGRNITASIQGYGRVRA